MKKRLLAIGLVLLLAGCAAPPVSSESTPQPAQTLTPEVISTSIPSPTEIPATPAALGPEVQAKLEEAGIDPNSIENAAFDQNGLTVMQETGEEIHFTNDELINSVVDENKIYVINRNGEVWVWSGKELTPFPLEIVNDEFNPENLPFAEWENLTDSKFMLKHLRIADKLGLIPHPNPETVIYLEPKGMMLNFDSQTGTRTFKNNGFDVIFNILDSQKSPNPNSKPFTYVGSWRTKLSGQDIIKSVYLWENKDGSIAFTSSVVGLDFIYAWEKSTASSAFKYKNFLQMISGINNPFFPTGTFYRDKHACIKDLSYGGSQSGPLCNWFFNNLDISFPKEFYISWRDTGIISNTFINEFGNKVTILPTSFARISE